MSTRRLSPRARHVEGRRLLLALLLAGLVFSLGSGLDLWVTHWFYAGAGSSGAERFPLNQALWVQLVYRGVPILGWLALGASVWLTLRWRVGRTPGSQRWGRRGLALLLVLLLGLWLVVHGVFKDHWGRPRPVAVQPFGGPHAFQPALQPSQACPRNCSFVSGHAGTGYVLMAVGLLGSPRTRRRWWWAGAAAGLGIGAVRIVQGGHFLSDVVFSGLFIWAVCWGVRALWLRQVVWRRRRRSTRPG